MRFVFIGPPGVGKGTQASRFCERHKIPHIATGDLLRYAIAQKTDVGLKAKIYIEAGKLVPDQVIIELMNNRIGASDARLGYVLDGFPRTIAQGEALGEVLSQNNLKLDRVLYFLLDDTTLMARILGRRSCPSCHRVYHLLYSPPSRDGFCDCGAPLVQREDDTVETVTQRLLVYRSETAPLIAYYERQGILTEIQADGPLEVVSEKIERVLQGTSS